MKKNTINSSLPAGSISAQRPALRESNHKSPQRIPAIVRNLIAGIVLLVIMTIVKNNNGGYKWMWENLVKANLETIRQNSEVTNEQKNLERHGNLFTFLNYINKRTPKNAVILMPRDSVLNHLNAKFKLSGLKNRNLVTFFLYPRRAVYPDNEFDKKELSKANYVAIVDYNGYELLKNAPKTRKSFSIEPLQ